MMWRRRALRRVWIVWSRRAAPGEGFSRIRAASTTSFNMADSHWQYTFVSGGINRDGWLTQPLHWPGKKYYMPIDSWMKSLWLKFLSSPRKCWCQRGFGQTVHIMLSVHQKSHKSTKHKLPKFTLLLGRNPSNSFTPKIRQFYQLWVAVSELLYSGE